MDHDILADRIERAGPKLRWKATAAAGAALIAVAGVFTAGGVFIADPETATIRLAAEESAEDDRNRRRVVGTVSAVNGSSFTLRRPNDAPIDVTTSSNTKFLKTVDATVAEATVGTSIAAHGTRADENTVAANHLLLRPEGAADKPERSRPSGDGRNRRGDRRVVGEVTANDGSTLTVKTTNGVQRVTTNAETTVIRNAAASMSDVTVGRVVGVGGSASGENAIAAGRVHVNASSHRGARPKPRRDAEKRAGARGTVSAVEGSSFTVTRPDDSRLTVTTSSDTEYRKTVDAAVADAAVGTFVVAAGTRTSNGSLAAERVAIMAARGEDKPVPRSPSDAPRVAGEVTANDGSTLTVKTADGAQTVTTSSATKVVKTTTAAFGDVTVGSNVLVGGARAADGSIAARHVHINASSHRGPGPRGSGREPNRPRDGRGAARD